MTINFRDVRGSYIDKGDISMSWEIIASLIVIVGSLISLGTVLARLVGTLTRLDVTLAALDKAVREDRDSNSKTHERIYNKLDDHETRIGVLEHDKEGAHHDHTV